MQIDYKHLFDSLCLQTECQRFINLPITNSPIHNVDIVGSELECAKLCLSPSKLNNKADQCYDVRYDKANQKCEFYDKIEVGPTPSTKPSGTLIAYDCSMYLFLISIFLLHEHELFLLFKKKTCFIIVII